MAVDAEDDVGDADDVDEETDGEEDGFQSDIELEAEGESAVTAAAGALIGHYSSQNLASRYEQRVPPFPQCHLY